MIEKDKPLIKKEEKSETLNQEEKLKQPIQENNNHVAPTSSRENVEVDKIYNLLRSSNEATREKQKQKRDDKRMEEIVNETSKKLQNDVDSPNVQEKKEPQINTVIKEKEIQEEEKTVKPTNKIEETQKIKRSIKNELPEDSTANKPKNGLLKFTLLITIIIIGYLVYDKKNKIVPTFSDLPSSIQENYVLKNQPSVPIEKLKFNNLPNSIQEQYIQKKEMINTQKHLNLLIKKSRELETQNSVLNEQINSLKQPKVDTEVVNKSFENKSFENNKKLLNQIELLLVENAQLKNSIKSTQTNIITKNYSEIINKEIFPAEKSSSKDYKIVKCYDVKAGSFLLTATCKKDITKFLNENKEAKRFEVIGIVDSQDFEVISGQTKIDNELQKYLNMGLGRYRVLETSWIITEILGKDIVLSPVNYTITSKKNNRGSIIRAYY